MSKSMVMTSIACVLASSSLAWSQTSNSVPPTPTLIHPPLPAQPYSPGSPASQSSVPIYSPGQLQSAPQPAASNSPSGLSSGATDTQGTIIPPQGTPLPPRGNSPSRSSADRLQYSNGYTWVAPSYYLTPPILTPAPGYDPGFYYGPGTTMYEPAFLHTTVVPYDPVWPYAYMGLPGTYYRERISYGPYGARYRLRTYTPRGRHYR